MVLRRQGYPVMSFFKMGFHPMPRYALPAEFLSFAKKRKEPKKLALKISGRFIQSDSGKFIQTRPD